MIKQTIFFKFFQNYSIFLWQKFWEFVKSNTNCFFFSWIAIKLLRIWNFSRLQLACLWLRHIYQTTFYILENYEFFLGSFCNSYNQKFSSELTGKKLAANKTTNSWNFWLNTIPSEYTELYNFIYTSPALSIVEILRKFEQKQKSSGWMG
jgi:hypothetical protein